MINFTVVCKCNTALEEYNIGNNCYTSYARCNTITIQQVILLHLACMHTHVRIHVIGQLSSHPKGFKEQLKYEKL